MKIVIALLAFYPSVSLAQGVLVESCEADGRALTCSVTNQTDEAIGRIEFMTVMTEQGRAFPWADQGGVLAIPGGLESGERFDAVFAVPNVPERAEGHAVQVELFFKDEPRIDGNPALVETIAQCWQPEALSKSAAREKVELSFSVSDDGLADLGSIRGMNSSDAPEWQLAYETARRAILSCGRTGLPTGKHEITFQPGITQMAVAERRK